MRVVVVLALLILAGSELAWAAQTDVLPETTTLRVRRALGVMALIPALLLFVLSHYRRRDYVRAWVAVWFCLAAPLFIFSLDADVLDLDTVQGREAALGWGRAVSAMAVLTWIGGMALLALSAGWIRGPVRWPRHLWPFSAVIVVSVTAASAVWGLVAVSAVLWIGGLACFVAGGVRFLMLARRERFAGALLIGLALSTVPIHSALSQLLSLAGLPVANRLEIWIIVYAILALGMHLLVFEDVTYELRQQNAALNAAHAELKAKAVTDALTGCYNRRFFDEIETRELGRHQRYNLPLSLIFFDCDRFKMINDRHGHEMGDRVLALIGRVLRAHIRQTDYAFRWGGDEFLLMVTCDEERAAIKAREVQDAFATEPMLENLPPEVALSAGWVTVPADAKALLPYVGEADDRMYAARKRPMSA